MCLKHFASVIRLKRGFMCLPVLPYKSLCVCVECLGIVLKCMMARLLCCTNKCEVYCLWCYWGTFLCYYGWDVFNDFLQLLHIFKSAFYLAQPDFSSCFTHSVCVSRYMLQYVHIYTYCGVGGLSKKYCSDQWMCQVFFYYYKGV